MFRMRRSRTTKTRGTTVRQMRPRESPALCAFRIAPEGVEVSGPHPSVGGRAQAVIYQKKAVERQSGAAPPALGRL